MYMYMYLITNNFIFIFAGDIIIIVQVSSVELLLDEEDRRYAGNHGPHHGPVHPGVADILDEEHAQIDDPSQSPEESHHT